MDIDDQHGRWLTDSWSDCSCLGAAISTSHGPTAAVWAAFPGSVGMLSRSRISCFRKTSMDLVASVTPPVKPLVGRRWRTGEGCYIGFNHPKISQVKA